jgi:hypothetical protein
MICNQIVRRDQTSQQENLEGSMTQPEQANRAVDPENKPRSAKKPYIKPDFRHEKVVFETVALSCGKIFASSGACRASRKTS